MTAPAPVPELSVLICTCRRPAWLAELVASIGADAEGRPGLEVVIVDNDPAASAGPLLAALEGGPLALVHAHLPEQNIALARNLALGLSRGRRVLYLDDDQFVRPGFFAALEEAWRRRPHWAVGLRPEVAYVGDVSAPMPPAGPEGSPPGLLSMPSRLRPLHPVDRFHFATGGLLIDRAALLALGSAPFDRAFGLTGGEDTELWTRLARRGLHVIWCPDVVVVERRTGTRGGRRYVLARELRVGMSDALIAMEREGVGRAALAARSAFETVALASWRALTAPHHPLSVVTPEEVARRLGQAFALLGGRWEAYR